MQEKDNYLKNAELGTCLLYTAYLGGQQQLSERRGDLVLL